MITRGIMVEEFLIYLQFFRQQRWKQVIDVFVSLIQTQRIIFLTTLQEKSKGNI